MPLRETSKNKLDSNHNPALLMFGPRVCLTVLAGRSFLPCQWSETAPKKRVPRITFVQSLLFSGKEYLRLGAWTSRGGETIKWGSGALAWDSRNQGLKATSVWSDRFRRLRLQGPIIQDRFVQTTSIAMRSRRPLKFNEVRHDDVAILGRCI